MATKYYYVNATLISELSLSSMGDGKQDLVVVECVVEDRRGKNQVCPIITIKKKVQSTTVYGVNGRMQFQLNGSPVEIDEEQMSAFLEEGDFDVHLIIVD